ncbi:hypothetical protein [Sinorhizobium fredii]|uniref:hypothetical protein n=1 Tax=Rhizobium fredii TaxID=380 RepID=UPI001F30D2E0|nr:hypothetical protein [Sinorhizobium fredii]
MASQAVAKNGFVLLSLCSNASRDHGAAAQRGGGMSLNREWKQALSREQAQAWMPKERPKETCDGPLKVLEPMFQTDCHA